MPVLIIRAALADRPEFQRALVPHFQLRPVKDPYFVPDFIAAPTSLEDITLTCVWIDSETEFVSPDAVLVCIDRVRRLLSSAKHPIVFLGLPITQLTGYVDFQTKLTEIGIEEGSQPPTCFPVWGPQGIPAAIVTVKTSMGPSVKKRVETHVLRVEQSGVPSVATILSTIMRRVQSRQESLNTSARLKFLQSGLPEVVAAHALQSMGSIAAIARAPQAELTGSGILSPTEAAAVRDFFDVERERVDL